MSLINKLNHTKASVDNIRDAIASKDSSFDTTSPLSTWGTAINNISVGGDTASAWTGSVDAAGLREIGWDDEDIAYYQKFVNWNAEDDEYHLVSDYDKQMYQDYLDDVFTIDSLTTTRGISGFYPYVEHLPKMDFSSKTNMQNAFNSCYRLVFIPMIDTSNATSFYSTFKSCYSLLSIPLLDTSKVTTFYYTFSECRTLITIPLINTSNVTTFYHTFSYCYSLLSIPLLDTSKVTTFYYTFNNCYSLLSVPDFNTSNVTNFSYTFSGCTSLVSVLFSDMSSSTILTYMLSGCYSLVYISFSNFRTTFDLSSASKLSQKVLHNLIDNLVTVSTTQTFNLGTYNLSKVSDEYKQIVTDKGWVLS